MHVFESQTDLDEPVKHLFFVELLASGFLLGNLGVHVTTISEVLRVTMRDED